MLGEFPWQVSVGDAMQVTDYVAPPYVLSSETANDETTWTLGEYVQGADIWKAFSLPGAPPNSEYRASSKDSALEGQGISSGGRLKILVRVPGPDPPNAITDLHLEPVFRAKATGLPAIVHLCAIERRSLVCDSGFRAEGPDLVGARANRIGCLTNEWIYLNYALISEDTGQAYDFGREVSYYFGRDSDGTWTEGNKQNEVMAPAIPPGRYYLRIEPESDAKFGSIRYTVTVTRDVPVGELYLAALAALLLPALLIWWRIHSFEQLRWAESDHPMLALKAG